MILHQFEDSMFDVQDIKFLPYLGKDEAQNVHESSHRWSSVGRRRVGHTHPEMLTCRLAFPAYPLHQRPVESVGSLGVQRAFHQATATVPAFLRIHDDGWLTLFWVGHVYIGRANLYAAITAVTDFGINDDRNIGGRQVGHSIYSFFSHTVTPPNSIS
jgi:hypothetical protein